MTFLGFEDFFFFIFIFQKRLSHLEKMLRRGVTDLATPLENPFL